MANKVLVNVRTLDWDSGNVQFDTNDDGGFGKFDAVAVMLNSMCEPYICVSVNLTLIDTSNNQKKCQTFVTTVGRVDSDVHTLAELMASAEAWGQ